MRWSWAEPMLAETLAQKVKLIALTKALELERGKKINVYTDGHCAFAIAHIYGAIYKERGLLTAEGKTIKNKNEIVDLLRTLWAPQKLAIKHCPGQKGDGPIQKGNSLAVQIAITSTLAPVLVDPGPLALPEEPKYPQEDLTWMKTFPMTQCLGR